MIYQIHADDTVIYDSAIEDYKITKGEITLEVEKAGSFVFAVYPENPFYDAIVELKTIIKVYRDSELIFKGRAIKVEDNFYKSRTVTCEGAYNFLLDSIIRPYTFAGAPADFFTGLIDDHNSQVDEEKQFTVGDITVVDSNNYIVRYNTYYESAKENIESRCLEDATGGYIQITYDANGNSIINWYADYPNTSSQAIEFGENLKDFTQTADAEDIATVIIPLGAKLTDDDGNETDEYLTIADVNDGLDYIEDEDAIAVYGRITKVVEFENITVAKNLLTKAQSYLCESVARTISIELNAIDLHMLDSSIDSFRCGEYVNVISPPHELDMTLLCKKQCINLLQPDKDTITLGYKYTALSDITARSNSTASTASSAVQDASKEITTLQALLNNLTVDDIKSGLITSEDYAETELPLVYPADDLYPSDSTYSSDGDTVITGIAIDFSTGTVYSAQLSSIEEQVSSINKQVSSLDEEYQTLSATVESLQSTADAQATTLQTIKNTLSEVKEAVEELQNSLTYPKSNS